MSEFRRRLLMATDNIKKLTYIETDGNCTIPTDIGLTFKSGCQISIYRPVVGEQRCIFCSTPTGSTVTSVEVTFSTTRLYISKQRYTSQKVTDYSSLLAKFIGYIKIWFDCTQGAMEGTYYETNTTTPYTLADLFRQATTQIESGNTGMTSSRPSTSYLSLFRLGYNQAGMRFYGAVIWDGNDGTTLTNPSHLLVPWKDASGQYCIKDVATEKIYYNTGSGTLTGA